MRRILRPTILVVDDDPSLRRYMRRVPATPARSRSSSDGGAFLKEPFDAPTLLAAVARTLP